MIDYTGAQTYKLEDVQVAHWLYYSQLGRYTAIVNVPNPKTSERIVLTVKDAYILAVYAMYRSFDIVPDVIPLMGAQRVQRYPIPSDADIRSVADMTYVDDFSWNAARTYLNEVEDMISIDAFYTKTVEIHKSANYQRNLISYQEGMHERGEVFKMVERYWGDTSMRVAPAGETFQQWLFARNLNFDALDRGEFELLFEALVAAAVGKSLTTAPSLRNVQKAMAAALKDLSSYTIQVVTKMADDETIMTDLPSVRIGKQDITAVGHEYLIVGDHEIYKQQVSATNLESLPINIFSDVLDREVKAKTTNYIDLQNGPHSPNRGQFIHHHFPMSRFEVVVMNKPDTSGTHLQPILGMDFFMAMTDDQKASLFEQ